MASKRNIKSITVVLTRDTFISGDHVKEGDEHDFEVELTPDGKEYRALDETLLHLRAANCIVEKGSPGHKEYLEAKAQRDKYAKAAAAKLDKSAEK